MQLNSSDIKFIIGDKDTIDQMTSTPAFKVFDPLVINYLDTVSKLILSDPEAKAYPDVITFGFWCRKASIIGMKAQYENELDRIGRGIAFHIAPANVAVNFAYSLVVGMLSGNENIVRIPSGDFAQVRIICSSLENALTDEIKPYICLVQYGHNQEINDCISSICDTRIIWGGDQTIMNLRKSPLKPRANEITFADRYSICIINAEAYLAAENKGTIAIDFYNDTYLFDQNACTSPRLVAWMGNNVKAAQEEFWKKLYDLVERKYSLQSVNAVSKYADLCKLAANNMSVHLNNYRDNFLLRVQVDSLHDNIMDYKGNCGFFIEYYADSFEELLHVCASQCQTLSYYGVDKTELEHFIIELRPRGIDRIVPIGKTMEFSLVWDGYDLVTCLSRKYTIK